MSEQTEDSILMQMDREIDTLKNQWGNPADEWTLVLSPEYYARFVDALHFMPDDRLTTGVVTYRGLSVVGSNYVPGVGVKLRKRNMGDIFERTLKDMLHAPGISREELAEIGHRILAMAESERYS